MALKVKQQGFTIVELLIVIVVIGILAALVITTFTGIQQKGRDTERTTDL
ncbi:MAG: prepilin-type N-terminal cleavage/methylation domain-containing protein, partial [Candidatus Saccharimonadales bacterium]